MLIDKIINMRIFLITGLVCALTLFIAFSAWKRRMAPGARYLSLIALMATLWGILFLFEISFDQTSVKLVFKDLQYIPMCTIPALYALLTLDTGALKLDKKYWWLLAIDPIFTNLMVLLNPLTHWFRRSISLLPISEGQTIIASEYSWVFWAHMIYVEAVVLLGVIAWGRLFFKSPRWNRGLTGTVFLAAILPWAASLITIPKWMEHSTDLLFLSAMLISLILLFAGIFQHRVLEVLPVAQDTLLAQLSDAVIVIDRNGKIASYNQAARKLPGMESFDPSGVPISALPYGWQAVAAACVPPIIPQKVITFGEGDNLSIYDLRITSLTDNVNSPLGALITMREITHEVNTVRHHQEMEDRYRAIFENASDAILLEDENERIIEVNQKACDLTGYTSDELREMRTIDLQPEEHRENPRLEEYEPDHPQTNQAVEIDLLHKDGSRIPVELTLAPISTDEHPLFLSIVRDVRERKQAEQRTRDALDDTQARVNELALLRQLAEYFNQAADVPSVLHFAMKTIEQIAGCSRIWVFLEEPGSEQFFSLVYDSSEGAVPTMHHCLPEEIQGGCLEKLRAESIKEPLKITSCTCSQGIHAEGFPVSEHYAFPLGVGKAITGLLNLVPPTGQTDLTEEKIHLVQTICDSLSLTIERIGYFEKERAHRERAETLQNIGTALSTTLNFEDVLDQLLTQLYQLVPYDAGSIMTLEGTNARILRHRGYSRFHPQAAQKLAEVQFDIHLTENLRVIRERQAPLIIGDTAQDRSWVQTEISANFRSWMGGPIIIQKQVAFIFSLDKVEPYAFSQDDADRLTSFTAIAALSIQNSRLYEAEKKRTRELSGLQATLRDISSELDLNQLLKKIIDRAISLTGASIGELALLDKNAGDLEVVVSTNLDKDYTGNRIKIGDGVLGIVAKTREPYIVGNYSKWDKRLPEYDRLQPQTGLAVPMLAGEELIGVIGVGDFNIERKFGEDDIRLLYLFAQQATVAIHNARLYKHAKRQAEEAETLRQAGSVIVSTLHQEESLERILEQLSTVVPYDSASVALLREGELQIVGGHGFTDPKKIIGMRFPLNHEHPGSVVFLDRKSMILKDAPQDFPEFNVIPADVCSWLGVPLTYKEKTIGILSLDSAKPDQFTEEHAHLVQAFADQVSISLENARLYEQAVRSASRQEIIYRLTQEINANLRVDQVCTAIHRATSSLMPTECFVISMLDDRAREIIDIYLVDRGVPQPLNRRPASQGLFAKVIADGQSRKYDTFDQTMIVRTGAILLGPEIDDSITQSILCVPLKLGNQVKGVLSAQSYQPFQYSQEDLETLESLAANGMIALENSRLFGEVQQLAITDPLTQVYNRRRFYELTELEFERSHRYGRPLSVIMLDIDHFKKVNDNFGHLVGDQILQRVAEICSGNLRQIDILARYGGEEFVILLPETNATSAYISAERLRREVAREPFSTMRGLINITISLGVVELDATCKVTEELLDRSDQAMYHSKRTGRNRTTVWTNEIKPAASGGNLTGTTYIK